jgi:hypothetical protein
MSGPPSSESGADGGTTESTPKLPEGAEPSSEPVPPKSGKKDDPKGGEADVDGGAKGDGGPAPGDDAGADAQLPTKANYGDKCAAHDECSTGLCLEFDGELRCTKSCKDDDDCHNGDDCDDDINVCELD